VGKEGREGKVKRGEEREARGVCATWGLCFLACSVGMDAPDNNSDNYKYGNSVMEAQLQKDLLQMIVCCFILQRR